MSPGGDSDLALLDFEGVALRTELDHHLCLKGYCVLDSSLEEDVLDDAVDDAVALKRAGRFQPPPQEIVEGFLGPEGSREYTWLTATDSEDYADGERLKAVVEQLNSVATDAAVHCGYLGQLRCSKAAVLRGGETNDEIVEMSEQDCSMWLQTFTTAKLMVIFFLGPGEGTLELQPFDDESGAVEITSRSGRIVVLRADMLQHRHVSTIDDYTVVCWITAAISVGARGWNEIAAPNMPVAKELLEWMKERLKVIASLEVEGKLDDSVPRAWMQLAHQSYFRHEKNPIAIRGDAGHMPGQWDPSIFWQSVNNGVDYVTEIPYMRWDHGEYYDPTPDSWMESLTYRPPTFIKTTVRHGQYIDGVELFDTKFFGISVMEAKGMDPMQKHVLETSYEALFAGGYKKKDLMNNYIAVYTGCTNPEWNYIDREAGACSGTGSSQAITSNRTSFALGMMGPSSSIDCEMSSSAVALMVGAAAVATTNSRRTESGGNCSASIVGGVYMSFTPFMWPRFNAWMNPKGRCFTFDENANGYVRGECCASVCLKPFAEKVDGEFVVPDMHTLGCMTGWRMVSNGRAASLTTPHGPAIQECLHDAVKDASVNLLDIDSIECHGSGGLLDDSIEASAVAAVLRGQKGGENETLVLGSVKANTGAQCEACGIASMLKVIYNIAYACNAPLINLKTLNPHIELGEGAIVFNTESVAFRGRSVFSGVSTRGLGGTMVNLVVWSTADGTKVQMDRPTKAWNNVSYWPGGGGMLEPGSRPAQGYFIVGSWGEWEQVEEMQRAGDGSFVSTVTLGMNGFETFQIWLDGEGDRILHPATPTAPCDTAALGPSEPHIAGGLSWMIDGRTTLHHAVVDKPAEGADAGAIVKVPERVPVPTRDRGFPGEQYEVKLLVAGKYRAVSWRKLGSIADASLAALIRGKYYVAGSFNNYDFQEMTASQTEEGLYTAEVEQGLDNGEFQIVRNKDWEQAFFPGDAGLVEGPHVSTESVFRLGGLNNAFIIEFHRTFDQEGSDTKKVSWRRRRSST